MNLLDCEVDNDARTCTVCGWKAPVRNVKRNCPKKRGAVLPSPELTDAERQELFPGEDPTLIGNRIAAMFAAIGVPACGGCQQRKEWLNKAHAWLRSRP